MLRKYGSAQDDYFRKSSYQRFLNEEIKNITKGNFSRTKEGLYCHHIDENKYLNMSNNFFVKKYKIPYEYHKKDRLVFCNLIEHGILHALISKETSFQYGYLGYSVYILPTIVEWYIDQKRPKSKWMKNCFNEAFLLPEEAVNIIYKMQQVLGEDYPKTLSEFYNERQKMIKKNKKTIEAREKENLRLEKEQKKRKEIEMKKRIEKFYNTYPKFKQRNINFNTPRQKVIKLLYNYKYNSAYENKNEFDLAMKPVIKDELLKELYFVIFNEK